MNSSKRPPQSGDSPPAVDPPQRDPSTVHEAPEEDQRRGLGNRSVTEIAVPACTAVASGWHLLRHSSGLEIPVAQSLFRKLPPARRASNMLLCLTGGRPMEGNFTLAKIRATVETGAMLLPGDQIDKTLEELRANLKRLGLAVLSIERTDVAKQQAEEALDAKDPWSFRGQARD